MKSIFSVFKKGLKKTKTSLSRTISGAITGNKAWNDEVYEELEAALIQADFGVQTALGLVEDIRDRYKCGDIATSAEIIDVIKEDLEKRLTSDSREINFQRDGKLTVIMFIGVNGSGKTTTIGKLAHHLKSEGKKVMLAACDTFRAAAVEQLKLWGERTDCPVVAAQHGADPSAVVFDAVSSALAKEADVLLIDTAGRQHTSKGLMDELGKICRTISKVYPNAPHEVWLTVDSTLGSNAVTQAKEFTKVANITGLALTKLDGTGKGGMAVAIHEQLQLPVFFAGFGEQVSDLQPFNADYYISAIFDKE
ncbi:signal recognition particle-docking protein FtsY [Lentisphaerota bacterium WC36G]|nr:signal recognition particle-docking protein FtsY [Lentisphaerae bacterium WC36]